MYPTQHKIGSLISYSWTQKTGQSAKHAWITHGLKMGKSILFMKVLWRIWRLRNSLPGSILKCFSSWQDFWMTWTSGRSGKLFKLSILIVPDQLKDKSWLMLIIIWNYKNNNVATKTKQIHAVIVMVEMKKSHQNHNQRIIMINLKIFRLIQILLKRS